MRHSEKQVLAYAGSITVRSYPHFNAQVSTLDIKNGISEYHKLKGHNPDIVIIDSMDLLTDARQLFQLPPCGDIHARILRYVRFEGEIHDLLDVYALIF